MLRYAYIRSPHDYKARVECAVELDRENVGWSVGSEVVESKSAVLVSFSLLTYQAHAR